MKIDTLYIMQGVPGSGKSTVAELIAQAQDGIIRSTDTLRYVSIDGKTFYNYVPAFNGFHHRINRGLVALDMLDGASTIIVDNTNIIQSEADPYIALAKHFSYNIQIVRVDPGLEISLKRNQLREDPSRVIPEDVIRGMYEKMERLSC